ncbi:MAG: DNA polymerase III subunit gamma/tau [Alphaproteobacteria bacterium]|nr:DNA polymerase III subunit gamma/tau [Alphaproteobacteria bacterium]
MTDPKPSAPDKEAAPSGAAYRVLARKYRPSSFAELIGQDALVRTLTNAIRTDRIAHAYVLTGVRGVGKTTTARIIARVLNCVGPDGTGGPTAEPCGVCEHCRAIADDRHVDVIEMDAASRTGVDDIRDLTDGVRYAPMSARFKVYIVDEVHMLSKQAFNALLKTLEEPPPHVKFIFATTEIRKIPVTVLSRCQRFDLRRVEAEILGPHLGAIAEKEGAKLAPDALALVARAADGSVRDGLSLLDRAIATYGSGGVGADQIRDMIGLADRTQIFDLFEALMAGKAAETLDLFAEAGRSGADPLVVLQDLLELVHWITRVKIVPVTADDPVVPEAERVRGKAAAQKLSMAALSRAWQMLLKGLGEAQSAPSPAEAAEMALIRLAYVAELPTPAEIVERLQSAQAPTSAPATPAPPSGGGETRAVGRTAPATPERAGAPRATTQMRPTEQPEQRNEPVAQAPAEPVLPNPQTFAELVELFGAKKEMTLYSHLQSSVHLVRFEPGVLEFRPAQGAPPTLANHLQKLVSEWTGRHWGVSVSRAEGQPTLTEQAKAEVVAQKAHAAAHPVVRAVLDAFPNAEIVAVHDLAASAAAESSSEPDDDGTTEPNDEREEP